MTLLPGTLDNILDFAKKTSQKSRYFNDPVLWAEEIVGVTMWSKQREICDQVLRERNLAVKAGHGVGKVGGWLS